MITESINAVQCKSIDWHRDTFCILSHELQHCTFHQDACKYSLLAGDCGNLGNYGNARGGPTQLVQQTGTHSALLYRSLTQTETVPAEMQTSESRVLLRPSVNVK